MELHSEELMYEFHAKDLSQPEALKQYADHAVKEIKTISGWDSHVNVNIESEAKDKHLYSVSMGVFGLDSPIVIKKTGKNALSLLRKVRKAVMRQIHRLSQRKVNNRRMSHRRKLSYKEEFVF